MDDHCHGISGPTNAEDGNGSILRELHTFDLSQREASEAAILGHVLTILLALSTSLIREASITPAQLMMLKLAGAIRAEFFYAIKANSDPAILRALVPVVAGFEVASAGEIRKVRAAVGPDVRIIMGGPARTVSDFEAALKHGVERVHIESFHLLHLANAVAAEAG